MGSSKLKKKYEVHCTEGFRNQLRWVADRIVTGKKQRWPIVPVFRRFESSWQSPVTVHGVVFHHEKPGVSYFWWYWIGLRVGRFS